MTAISWLSRTAAAGIVAAAGLAGAAEAQQGCGSTYTVQPGDTLAGIAARCDTSVDALVRANEQIDDPSRIAVGWELAIPGGESQAAQATQEATASREEQTPEQRSDDGGAPEGAYTVQAGDTLAGIATTLGVSLFDLLAENEGIDPFRLEVGQPIRLPPQVDGPRDDAPAERLTLEGRVTGSGDCALLETPDGDVWALVSDEHGITDGEYVEVRGSRADEGCERQTVKVTAIEEIQPPQEGRGSGGDEGDGRIALEGRVESGTECPVLRTQDGDVYSLVSDDIAFTPGEYVEITGETVDMSFCMQGTTVRVTEIREIPAPQGG